MLILTCPNCGPRSVSEFRFGGEYNPRPADPAAVDNAAWTEYIYFRNNVMGAQTEWWYHTSGCGLWFLAERHTGTDRVIRTFRWQPRPKSGENQRAT